MNPVIEERRKVGRYDGDPMQHLVDAGLSRLEIILVSF
jgi:hypothetical protein